MLFVLGNRTRLDISAQHDRNPLYVRLSDGSVRNAYTVKVRNMENRERTVEISMSGLPGATMWDSAGSRDKAGRAFSVRTAPDAVTKLRLFIVDPKPDPSRKDLTLSVRGTDEKTPSDVSKVICEGGW